MINPSIKDKKENEGLSSTKQKENFLTAFTQVAKEAIVEYRNNINKQAIQEVKKPDETEESLA